MTPIRVDLFHNYLRNHPRPELVRYVISGLRLGFDIGFRSQFHYTNTRPNNLLPTRNNAAKVTVAANKEVD